MGSVGAGLVLVAATVFAVTNWSAIPLGVKWASLVAVNGAVVAAGERTLQVLPAVARVLQHLGALLVPVSAAATVLAIGGDWPEVALSAGAAGVLSVIWQSRLRAAPLLESLLPVAFVLALAGVAGRTGAPLPLLVAVLAVGLVLVNRYVDATRVAATVVLLPVLATLEALPVGAGTAARLGLVGADLSWSAPASGMLAGCALALVANRRGQSLAALGAVVAIASGAVTGLGALDPGPQVWHVALAAAAFAVMVAAVATAADVTWARVLGPLGAVVEVISGVAMVGFAAAAVVAVIEQEPSPTLAFAALLWTAAAAGAVLQAAPYRLFPPPLGVLVAAVLAMTAAGLGLGVAAAAAVTGLVGMAASVWFRTTRITMALAVLTTVTALVDVVVRRANVGPLTVVDTVGGLVLAITCAALVVAGAVRARPGAAVDAWILHVSTPLAALVAASAALAVESRWAVAVATAAAGCTVVAAELARVRQAVVAWYVPLTVFGWGSVATLVLFDTPLPAVVTAAWSLVGLLAVAPAYERVSWWSWRPMVVGAALAVPITLSFWAGGFAGLELALLVAGGAVPAAGLAVLSRRANPLDALAAALVGCGVLVSWVVEDKVATGSVLLIGSVSALAVALLRGPRWVGSIAATLGFVGGMYLVSGFDVAGWIEREGTRFGVTPGDVGVAIVAALLLIGGGLLGAQLERPSSWLTVAPGVGLLAAHLLATLIETGEPSRVAAGVAVGAVATGVGGLRRRSAPLVLGTGLIVCTVALATRTDLARLPVWSWLALGGVGLLAVAVLIERGLELARRADVSLVDCLLHDFR